VRRTRNGVDGIILSKGDSKRPEYRLQFTASNQVVFEWLTPNKQSRKATSSRTITDTSWHHIAGVYHAAARRNRLYIDGVLAATSTTSGTPRAGADALLFGAMRSGKNYSRWLTGDIDLVRISSGALYTADFTPPRTYQQTQTRDVVELTWQPPLHGTPATYDVQRSLNGAAYALLQSIAAPTTTFTDPTLPAGYLCYRVVARDSVGATSSPSDAACTLFGDMPPLGAPLDLTAALRSDSTSVQLQWTPPQSGAVIGYHVYRQSGSAAFELIDSPTSPGCVDSVLAAGTYTYRVAAVDPLGEGPSSDTVQAVVPSLVPTPQVSAPRDVTLEIVPVQTTDIAAYAFDEAQGAVTQDVSGHGHDAVLGDLPASETFDPIWTTGIAGSALQFDGANDRCRVEPTPALQIPGSFTLEAWVQRGTPGTRDGIVNKGLTNARNYGLRLSATGTVEFLWSTTGGASRGATTALTIVDANWHHIAAVWDQQAGQSRVYVDGVLAASTNETGTPFVSNEPMYIGCMSLTGVPEHFFAGKIDQVRITAAALYAANFTPAQTFPATPANHTRLRWSAPETGVAAGYHVYRSSGAAAEERLTTAPITALEYLDTAPPAGNACYRVAAVDAGGLEASAAAVCTGTAKGGAASETAFTYRGPNFATSPNPFNPTTTLRFALPVASDVSLSIYDVRGRRVTTLVRGRLDAGQHAVTWQGQDDAGRDSATGIYFAVLQAGSVHERLKLILMK
jgi:hypothetical protein